MTVEIRVPALGESLTTAIVARWLKEPGTYVQHDEAIVELETDKVSVDVPSPSSGVLATGVAVGTEVEIGALLGHIDETAQSPATQSPAAQPSAAGETPARASDTSTPGPAVPEPVRTAPVTAVPPTPSRPESDHARPDHKRPDHRRPEQRPDHTPRPHPEATPPSITSPAPGTSRIGTDPRERRVPLSRLRQTIARNLKSAQNTAAILTTFNEIDMSAARALRAEYREAFEKKHDGARLGFMSFFAQAVVGALRDYPALNAQIDGDDIVYRDFVNLGIAVGTERGLVVPVLHDADKMSFPELERRIADYGKRARSGGLRLEELSHGTFSITNGGIFGSLLSTPILNTPQSGILGMHAIQDRPVARDGAVVIRPMMYVALSYDHRLVDGREAVSFLVRVKQLVEDPRRLLLDL